MLAVGRGRSEVLVLRVAVGRRVGLLLVVVGEGRGGTSLNEVLLRGRVRRCESSRGVGLLRWVALRDRSITRKERNQGQKRRGGREGRVEDDLSGKRRRREQRRREGGSKQQGLTDASYPPAEPHPPSFTAIGGCCRLASLPAYIAPAPALAP